MLTAGVSISGLAGESLRTNYPRFQGLMSAEEALDGFDRLRFGRGHYVRPEALDDLRRRAKALFAEPLEHGARPSDLFDIFYVQHRLRRWVGDRPDRFHRYVFPLYSPSITRTVLAIGWTARADAEVHTEIRRRAGLPIDDIEFAKGSGWDSKPGKPATPAAQPPGMARPPAQDRIPAPTGPVRNVNRAAARRDAVLAAVDHDPANRAFEVVDKEALLADAARFPELDRRQRVELHSALTLVLWLGLAGPR